MYLIASKYLILKTKKEKGKLYKEKLINHNVGVVNIILQ